HVPGGALRGLAIFSKHPLEQMETQAFGDPNTISISGIMRINGSPLHFVVTHPWPPAGAYGYNSRNTQLQNVARFMAELPEPKFLIGDLNLSMWSVHYESLIQSSGLVNVRQGFGVLPSFPMDSYYVLRVPIDHCLVSPDVHVVDCRLGEPCGSDHAPLVVEIALP
ncbi:MAG: endonuclease/exonuclease/phosphatase family protein, partial [Planctomycetota bacterium]|nr:endonuclease/exonuclease/phosphatase family protein [Planctomycetota bacterium]